jgi:hypothetical protein
MTRKILTAGYPREVAMGTLLSVNVGLPKDVPWQGRTVRTGAWKAPVSGRRMVRRLNVEGDGQGDLAGHGGEIRAVLVYQLDSYRYWRNRLDRDDLTFGIFGIFGENFTVDGLPDDEVCIGDRYRIGEAEFEVTPPLELPEPGTDPRLLQHTGHRGRPRSLGGCLDGRDEREPCGGREDHGGAVGVLGVPDGDAGGVCVDDFEAAAGVGVAVRRLAPAGEYGGVRDRSVSHGVRSPSQWT